MQTTRSWWLRTGSVIIAISTEQDRILYIDFKANKHQKKNPTLRQELSAHWESACKEGLPLSARVPLPGSPQTSPPHRRWQSPCPSFCYGNWQTLTVWGVRSRDQQFPEIQSMTINQHTSVTGQCRKIKLIRSKKYQKWACPYRQTCPLVRWQQAWSSSRNKSCANSLRSRNTISTRHMDQNII